MAEGPGTGPAGRRVALVDDDDWVRRGREAVLVDAGCVVVASTDQAGALATIEHFDRVDVVLVDAHDQRAGFDRYRGVQVVEAIRRRAGPGVTAVVVITGHVLDDVLRLRMADAGADALYAHGDIRTPDQLLALVEDPRSGPVAPPPSADELAALGLGEGARPNDALAFIEEAGLEEAFASATEGESQKALPAGRRRLLTARRQLGDLLDARPNDPRARSTDWRSLVRVVDRLRGRTREP